MKTLRLAAACAVALSVGFLGHAYAQNQPAAAQTAEQPAQDVGGIADASHGEMGRSMATTHQQVYQDLVNSQQSGQTRRLNETLYHGK